MATAPKTIDVEVALNLVLSDHAGRVIKALDANKGVLLPTINQLMAEAWTEGYRAMNREWAQTADIVTPDEDRFVATNPYTTGASK